jgi:ribosomal protein S18 acetylase RimI-like enzyme
MPESRAWLVNSPPDPSDASWDVCRKRVEEPFDQAASSQRCAPLRRRGISSLDVVSRNQTYAMQTSDAVVPSLDRIQRTLAVDISYTISRMEVLERLPGNPIGINYKWVDETAVALMSRLPSFSRVVGLRTGHERHIEQLVCWYREHGIRPTFEMITGHITASLGRELARFGFFQSGFHVSLICEPASSAAVGDPVAIEQIATARTMEDYLDAYVGGWQIPEKDQAQFKANVRPWLNRTGWSLYLGRLYGQPAAAATLYLKDGVGYLADATTRPAFRRRGFQSALLRRRICDAAAAGADTVFSGAAPFSMSHRNMERIGMRVQFVRSLWTPN